MPPRNPLISLNLQKIAHFWIGNLSVPFLKPRMRTRYKTGRRDNSMHGSSRGIEPKTASNINSAAHRPLQMGNMKKIFFFAILVVIQTSIVFADEVEQGLMGSASDQIKASARQVIRAGADSSSVVDVTHVMLQNNFKSEQVLRAHEIIDQKCTAQGFPCSRS